MMSGEVGTPSEGFPTFPALIRLLSGVDSLMDEEEREITEGFATLATFIGFLCGMMALRTLEHLVLTKQWLPLRFSFNGVPFLMNNKG